MQHNIKYAKNNGRQPLHKVLFSLPIILIFAISVIPVSAYEDNWTDYVDESTFNDFNISVSGSTFTINSPWGLAWAANDINTKADNRSGKTFLLADNIDLSGHYWTPIGNLSKNNYIFQGTFDGKGKTISNLYIYNLSADYQGLFGYTSNANITNLNLTNVSITGMNNVGGLVGYFGNFHSKCFIENCSVSGEIYGVQFVGGLVGQANIQGYNVSIKNIYINADVSGYDEVGGIIGRCWGGDGTAVPDHPYSMRITNCYATGTVNCIGMAGGLIGMNVLTSNRIFYINNSTALNQYVNSSYSDYVHRIIGYKHYSISFINRINNLTNNYGWDGMKNYSSPFTENIGLDLENGSNVSNRDVWCNESFFKDTLGWDFENTWAIESPDDGNCYPLPYLKSLGRDDSLREKVLYLRPNYIVTFNNNSGDGIMEEQIFPSALPQNLTPNKFSKRGYTFTGWNTNAEGSGIPYTNEQKINITYDLMLYAVWKANVTNITLKFNNGTLLNKTVNISYGDNSFSVPPIIPEYDGYTFLGYFNESSGGVQVINNTLGLVQNAVDYTSDGLWINDTRDIELWAVWEKIPETTPTPIPTSSGTSSSPYTTTYIGGINSEVIIGDNLTVFFNSTGGSHVDDQTNLHHGDKVTEPDDPTKYKYIFDAWYTADAYKWDFNNDTVNKSFTLYANWTAIPEHNCCWFWIIPLIIAGTVITAVIIKKKRNKNSDEEDYDVLS